MANRQEPTVENEICAICLDSLKTPTQLKGCGHVYCHSCISSILVSKKVRNTKLLIPANATASCPLCRDIFRKSDLEVVPILDRYWRLLQRADLQNEMPALWADGSALEIELGPKIKKSNKIILALDSKFLALIMNRPETLPYPHSHWPIIRQIDDDVISITVNNNNSRVYFPQQSRGRRSMAYDVEGHRFKYRFRTYEHRAYRHILHVIDLTMRYVFSYAIFLPQLPIIRIQEEKTIVWEAWQGSPPRPEQDIDLYRCD